MFRETDPAYLAASLLLQWVQSAADGFPDETLLDHAVQYARIAIRLANRDAEANA